MHNPEEQGKGRQARRGGLGGLLLAQGNTEVGARGSATAEPTHCQTGNHEFEHLRLGRKSKHLYHINFGLNEKQNEIGRGYSKGIFLFSMGGGQGLAEARGLGAYRPCTSRSEQTRSLR